MLQRSAPSARRHSDSEHGAGPNAEYNMYPPHQLDGGPYIMRADAAILCWTIAYTMKVRVDSLSQLLQVPFVWPFPRIAQDQVRFDPVSYQWSLG
jgi:hypothetical protein